WAVGDRLARAAAHEQAETVRLAAVEDRVRDSLNTARTLVADNKLGPAGEQVARARAHLGGDGAVLGDLAAEVAAAETELQRYQQFLDLIDQAHVAEVAPLLQATLAADGPGGKAGTAVPPRWGDRLPAAAVPFVLEALQRYGVLERDDWISTLEGGFLGKPQVEALRRTAYEEL